MEEWKPRTELGRKVLSKSITNVNEVLDNGMKILEAQIADTLVPDLASDLLLVGQSKGKFGGGRRRVFRQTQKKTREGNKPRFAAYAVVGNKDGIVGLGYGKARETVPARDKAIRQAKLNIFKIARGSGSWEGQVDEPHTIPFRVEGRCGSVRVVLMPAPKGKGLIAEQEIQKILALAGVKDVWSRTFGQTKNKINLIRACEEALRKLVTTKVQPHDLESLSITYGPANAPAVVVKEPSKDARPAESGDEVPIPLTEVKGIGPARVDKLNEVGISSVQDLAASKPAALSQESEVSETIAKKLIARAKQFMEEGQ